MRFYEKLCSESCENVKSIASDAKGGNLRHHFRIAFARIEFMDYGMHVMLSNTYQLLIYLQFYAFHAHLHHFIGAPVAQWDNRCPTDLAVLDSSAARGEILSTVNGVSMHTAFYYHPSIILI